MIIHTISINFRLREWKKTLIFNLTNMKILSVTVSEVSEKITTVSNLIWHYIGMFYFVLLLVKKTLDDP